MKVFVLDRQRPRVFWVRQLGAGGLRLVSDVCDEPTLAGGGDMQQLDEKPANQLQRLGPSGPDYALALLKLMASPANG